MSYVQSVLLLVRCTRRTLSCCQPCTNSELPMWLDCPFPSYSGCRNGSDSLLPYVLRSVYMRFVNRQERIQDFGMGARVSRRRRGRGLGQGCPPSQWGWDLGFGWAPSPEFFLTFWLKIVRFGVYSDKNYQFIRPIASLKTAFKW